MMRLLPGVPNGAVCIACSSQSDKRQYFDTGSFIDHQGRILICHYCVLEGGHELGMMLISDHEKVKEHNREYLKQDAALRGRIFELEAQVDAQAREITVRSEEARAHISRLQTKIESSK